jgi:formylglycine-generating enzyme required for sulfatase activity
MFAGKLTIALTLGSFVFALAMLSETVLNFGVASGAIKTKENPKDGQQYIWIKPGSFQMGCSDGDNECYAAEKPAHPVTITRGFWMEQTPVTQEAYQRVQASNPSHFHGEKLPVESVTWNQAKAYCEAVGGRLPNEAEWEYAARAGTTTPRYGELDAIAWYRGNSGNSTHPVRQKMPNPWGLYDMLGNVWQWTADWSSNYGNSPSADPPGPATGKYRVARGGSWNNASTFLRASVRYRDVPDFSFDGLGFRCVQEVLP